MFHKREWVGVSCATVFLQEVNIRFITIIIIIIIIMIIIIVALAVYTGMSGVLPVSIPAAFAQQLLRTGWQHSLSVSCARSFSMESRGLLSLAVLHFSLAYKLFKTKWEVTIFPIFYWPGCLDVYATSKKRILIQLSTVNNLRQISGSYIPEVPRALPNFRRRQMRNVFVFERILPKGIRTHYISQ